MRDPVAEAIAAIDRAGYATWADGSPVRQVSNPEIVERMLRLLDVATRSRVLEVGTGSGYGTALLARLVGPSGSVVSLDVDAELVRRATSLFGARATHVRILERDGRLGHAERAPYDALVAWASVAGGVPHAWRDQVREGGAIVTPFADRRIRKLRVVSGGGLAEEAAIEGGFVPLTAEPFRPWETGL